MGKTSTGVDQHGYDILFEHETYPYPLTDITFLVPYTRTVPQGAYMPNVSAGVTPNNVPINDSFSFAAGDGTRVGVNEAAALVARGVAKYA